MLLPLKSSHALDTAAKRFADLSGSKLNASIRERLKAKVKGIQARAAENEGKPERKLRGLRELPIPDRFEDEKVNFNLSRLCLN